MPELPEVETTVRALRPFVVGQTIIGVRNNWPRHIATPTLPELQARIHGTVIQSVDRRAKFLVFTLSQQETLIIHLRMSGHLSVQAAAAPVDKHVHTVFELDNGQELRFRDQRKFGRVYLVRQPQTVLGKLGPEPLDDFFTPQILAQQLNGRRRAIKSVLLEQDVVAGIGNIYADEALYYARVRPTRLTHTLSENEIQQLHQAIQYVLQLGIDREGASIDLYTKPDGSKGEMQQAVAVFRRTGDPCYGCGAPIERIKLGGRSTHFCPHCQQ
jgi:formamidopyrimidine-DNA glycosylase